MSDPQVSSTTRLNSIEPWRRTLYPIGTYVLEGLATWQNSLLSIDSSRGYLVQINPDTDNTTILNPYHLNDLVHATSVTVWEDMLWFTRDRQVYYCTWTDFTPQLFVNLNDPADGVAVWESTVYVTCQKSGDILIFNRQTAKLITRLRAPGVGIERLAIRGEELWIVDRDEQSVYCLDRATGEILLSVLTPFANPTGLAFLTAETGQELLYVVYSELEAYIRDDPSSDPPQQLSWRDRTFIHPLHIYHNSERHYSLSNGYLIEMAYVEELSAVEDVSEIHLEQVQWRIALPSDTERQKVHSIEPIGIPFTEEIQDGQRVAVFKFDTIKPTEGRLFGWKATLEVRSIKYNLVPLDVEQIPPLSPDLQARYLIDDDELAMDTPIVKGAAQRAIGTETNILRKMLKIRNYVYDSLDYSLTSKIESPDVVLNRGIGSCGEYVGVLLALARLNGIACRTIGRYKCPATPERQGTLLEPDYNHVWLEFYIPGFGWVPMESNPDDRDYGPHLTRFFMGLAWYHIEIGKGITFEKLQLPEELPEDVSLGDFAINHVRFKILQELSPVGNNPLNYAKLA